jgi:hypothetical protein
VKKLAMPDLIGAPWSAATERLRSMGVKHITSKRVENVKARPGEVLSQTPDAGAAITIDTTVTFEYASEIQWIKAPRKLSSSDDVRASANEQCPAVCRRVGSYWQGHFKYGTIVSCACEIK